MASPRTFTGPPTDLAFSPDKLTEPQRKFWDDSNAFLARLKRSQPSLPPSTYAGLEHICWSLQHRFNETRDLRAEPVHDVLAELEGLRADLTNPLVTRYAAYLRLNRLMNTANVRRDYFKQFFGRFALILPAQGGGDLLLFSPSKAKATGANMVAVDANGDETPVARVKDPEASPKLTATQGKVRRDLDDFHGRLVQNKDDLPPDVYNFLYATEDSLNASFADNPNLSENPVHHVLAQLDMLLDDMLNPLISTYDALRRINQLSTTKHIHKESLGKYFGQFSLAAGPDIDLLTLQMQSVKLIAPAAAAANPNRVSLAGKFDEVEHAALAASVSPAQDPDTDIAPDPEPSEGEARWCIVS